MDVMFAMGTGFVIGMLTVRLRELGWQPVTFSLLTHFLIGSFVGVVAETVGVAIGGATIGKMVFGLRVRTIEGGPPSFGAALKRAIAYYWDAFFFGIVGYSAMKASPLQQRVGDRWANTVVVHQRSLSDPGTSRALLGSMADLLLSAAWMLLSEIAR